MSEGRKARAIAPLKGTRRNLMRRFTAFAADMPAYAARVSRECSRFPIGPLLPFAVPALALSIAGADGGPPTPAELETAGAYLDAGLAALEKKHHVPVLEIQPGSQDSIYLGWALLALAVHEQAAGHSERSDKRRHLAAVLRADLLKRKGVALNSYPGKCWPFDTVPGLLGLKLSDELDNSIASAGAIQGHLDWMLADGRDPALDLPLSYIAPKSGKHHPPRGCDLSLRQGLTEILDPDMARAHWRAYTKHFWQEQVWAAGFREYPRDYRGAADSDSGALLSGFGFVATAFGLVAAASAGDRWRTWRLSMMFAVVDTCLSAVTLGHWVPFPKPAVKLSRQLLDHRLTSGFLFGDVCLLHSVSWPLLVQSRQQR